DLVFRHAENGAWLALHQRTIGSEPEALISGTLFNPPSFKGRGTATWNSHGWGISAAYNYVNSEKDESSIPAVHIGSWSTVDVQLSYEFNAESGALLQGLKLRLSVQNLFDRDPPFVAASSTAYPGLGYDSTNASPFGRFISADVSKSW
ncbi:MAG: TonB-dependent receptor domain-containing protein, partial [Steroidobacteraceae bacterium]